MSATRTLFLSRDEALFEENVLSPERRRKKNKRMIK